MVHGLVTLSAFKQTKKSSICTILCAIDFYLSDYLVTFILSKLINI